MSTKSDKYLRYKVLRGYLTYIKMEVSVMMNTGITSVITVYVSSLFKLSESSVKDSTSSYFTTRKKSKVKIMIFAHEKNIR